ncbi:Protein SLG1 [Paecilomyces lecythidis]|uniref:Protein SLG1 n=1 Tax=Paecilomyces lecythidis TaxID=3004212 RepID=A0ABR3WSK2_9EURO
MKSLSQMTAMTVSTLLLALRFASADPDANPDVALKTMTDKGCYSSSEPLTDQGSYTFQSTGYCQKLCANKNFSVMALTKGSNCLCGNELPPSSAKTDDSDCQTPCDGWPASMCGGDNAYSVFLTGTEENVPTFSSSSSSTTDGKTSTTAEQPHVITQAGQTIVVTAQSQTDAADHSSSSGANTAGIAAGVVVGVVGFASLLGGAFFFYRYKKRKSIEDEYRRNADINTFVAGGGKPMSSSSMSDSRFDGDFMAQRRQSNGSIADDQDFSRRILKVTNPDGV